MLSSGSEFHLSRNLGKKNSDEKLLRQLSHFVAPWVSPCTRCQLDFSRLSDFVTQNQLNRSWYRVLRAFLTQACTCFENLPLKFKHCSSTLVCLKIADKYTQSLITVPRYQSGACDIYSCFTFDLHLVIFLSQECYALPTIS